MESKVALILLLQAIGVTGSSEAYCRDRFGYRSEHVYSLFSCAWCYSYLFPDKPLYAHPKDHFLRNKGPDKNFQIITPDHNNETSIHRVCQTLTSDECQRWQSCCQAAHACCKRQLLQPADNSSCAPTWDGWGCWDMAAPGTDNYLNCPMYLEYSLPNRQAVKTCLSNGTWLQKNGHYWTDYTPCSNIHELKTSLFIGMGCSIASIVVLIPAIFIFFIYKSLQKQHRIRLHINFFAALLFKEISTILWDMLVTYDRVTNKTDVFHTVLVQNKAGCKVLSFLKIYFKCTTYSWMFCEGFYLHRLMSNAFSPPRSLISLYLAGWGVPLLSSIIYAILRALYANESCWSRSYEDKEWIFDAPNLACLLANFVFLCNILRILLTQLQSHPNEPSNFRALRQQQYNYLIRRGRKAVKATFILIPLFGVQLFVTIYRYPIHAPGGLEYERFSIFVNHLQGFFVALIFCFLNSEVSSYIRVLWCRDRRVITHLRKTYRRRIRDRSSGSTRRLNATLNQTLSMNTETLDRRSSERRSRREHYPLKDNPNGDIVRKENGVKCHYDPVPDVVAY